MSTRLTESKLQEIRARTPKSDRYTAIGSITTEPCSSVHRPNAQGFHLCCSVIKRYMDVADADRNALLAHCTALEAELQEARAEIAEHRCLPKKVLDDFRTKLIAAVREWAKRGFSNNEWVSEQVIKLIESTGV